MLYCANAKVGRIALQEHDGLEQGNRRNEARGFIWRIVLFVEPNEREQMRFARTSRTGPKPFPCPVAG